MDHLKILDNALFFLLGAVITIIILTNYSFHGFPTSDWSDEKAAGFWSQHNYTDTFYCVWVSGLSEEEINDTEYHEACHDFIYRDPEHFCS